MYTVKPLSSGIRLNPDIFKNNAEPKRMLNTCSNPKFRLSEQNFSKKMVRIRETVVNLNLIRFKKIIFQLVIILRFKESIFYFYHSPFTTPFYHA